jgi:hypothetical protein
MPEKKMRTAENLMYILAFQIRKLQQMHVSM